MNLHCSQTLLLLIHNPKLFVTPMNLHCSQTADFVAICFPWFVTPMNLHCSQTSPAHSCCPVGLLPLWIYTALKPIYSIPVSTERLLPLWIYTALKLHCLNVHWLLVCYPYEFTLLSNNYTTTMSGISVCYPYEFTLLSNNKCLPESLLTVCYPYEFTLLSNLKLSKNNHLPDCINNIDRLYLNILCIYPHLLYNVFHAL